MVQVFLNVKNTTYTMQELSIGLCDLRLSIKVSKSHHTRMVTQFCNPTQTYDRIKNIGFEVGILSVILGKCKNHVLYEVVLESQTLIYYHMVSCQALKRN